MFLEDWKHYSPATNRMMPYKYFLKHRSDNALNAEGLICNNKLFLKRMS